MAYLLISLVLAVLATGYNSNPVITLPAPEVAGLAEAALGLAELSVDPERQTVTPVRPRHPDAARGRHCGLARR